MKTFLSMFGYAIVACSLFLAYFISPRMYAVMVVGIIVYAMNLLFYRIYASYIRLFTMKAKAFIKKFRIEIPSPILRSGYHP